MAIYYSLFFLLLISSSYSQTPNKYLERYGYLKSINNTMESNEKYHEGLRIFQEYWNLPVDGTFNEETKNVMEKPRCGNADHSSEYNVYPFKWKKQHLTWYFYAATSMQIHTAKKVFEQWSKVSGLEFSYKRNKNVDIIISFKKPIHRYVSSPEPWCDSQLSEGVVGHAFFPASSPDDKSPREIHLSASEEWDDKTGTLDKNKISLYWVLLHEVGHVLGIQHTLIKDNLMNPIYQSHNSTLQSPFGEDDIKAIQYLYKPDLKNNLDIKGLPTIPHTPSSIEPSVPKKNNDDNELNDIPTEDDICRISPSDLEFFISRKRMYILYKKWAWPLSLMRKKYEKPQLITNWLSFLPKNLTKISALYEKPSGDDVVLFADNNIYEFNRDKLTLNDGWPKTYQEIFGETFDYNSVKQPL